MLYQTIEPDIYSQTKSQELFSKFSDMKEGNTELLNLKQFSLLAAKNHIFTLAAQSKLLRRDVEGDYTKESEILKNVFGAMKDVLKVRLIKAGKMSEIWNKRLDECEKRITNPDYTTKCIFLIKY